MTSREIALDWFYSKTELERTNLMVDYLTQFPLFKGRRPVDLTGREIEKLYNAELEKK